MQALRTAGYQLQPDPEGRSRIRQPMPRQPCVGGLHQAKQLTAIALELESGAQQLQILAEGWRPLVERIGIRIR
jgi:hypothetical protein